MGKVLDMSPSPMEIIPTRQHSLTTSRHSTGVTWCTETILTDASYDMAHKTLGTLARLHSMALWTV